MGTDSINNPLESQIRECYGRVVYTHKAHEKCADEFNKSNQRIKICQIVLSALTACGVLVIIFKEGLVYDIISALLAFVTLGVNLYLKEFDLGSIAQKHANSAVEMWDIRESYLSLITDIQAGLDEKTIIKRRNELQERLKSIYKVAPRTNNRAYSKAQKAIQAYDEMTFSDSEIDALLPPSLRKTGN